MDNPEKTVMKKRISRRQLIMTLAMATGGAGLAWARHFLTAPAARGSDSVPEPRVYIPLVMRQPTPTSIPSDTPTPIPSDTPTPIPSDTPTPIPSNICDEIRQEALAPNSETYHPLPLIGSWNASTFWNYDQETAGLYPGWQLDMIEQENRHFLPWFEVPVPSYEFSYWDYFASPIQRMMQLDLPISFVGVEWEHYLYDDHAYFDLPRDQNPNVVALDGTIQKKISPFGPVRHWREVGRRWGEGQLMQQLISWYPDPPLAIFVSNNEAEMLRWVDAETDQHYLDRYGYGRDDDFKRQAFSEGWQERYLALIQGFRDGLGNSNWQARSRFIAYQAFGPGWFGSWEGWKEYSLYVPNRIDPHPLFWQGGSPSLYICGKCNERDNNVQGTLFHSMNWVFILEEAYQLDPSFWYEFSSWDGDQMAQDAYDRLGQSLTPERYGGFVQFAMWAVRPRMVRVYRDWDQSRSEVLPWFAPAMNAVERVYTNPILRSFWRYSTIVANRSRPHPYQSDIPPEYSAVDRMFLLNTNLDPAQPWSFDTEFPVMSVARVKGTSPNRQWLLYAYAPLGAEASVEITIPEYDTVTVRAALEGSFYLIDEWTEQITTIDVI